MPCSIRLSTEETAIFYRNWHFGGKRTYFAPAIYHQCCSLAQHAAKPAVVLVFIVINTAKTQGIFAWPTTKNLIKPA